jgi:hypothetical protein
VTNISSCGKLGSEETVTWLARQLTTNGRFGRNGRKSDWFRSKRSKIDRNHSDWFWSKRSIRLVSVETVENRPKPLRLVSVETVENRPKPVDWSVETVDPTGPVDFSTGRNFDFRLVAGSLVVKSQ